MTLEQQIERLASIAVDRSEANLELLAEFRRQLNAGTIRVAEFEGDAWRVHVWVKQGILLHAVYGINGPVEGDPCAWDSDVQPLRRPSADDQVRVARGALVRDGVRLGEGAMVMSGAVVNMGVWLGDQTVVDAQSGVGLCAQIGDRVHVGTGVQIGGLLQPLAQLPVIVGDDVVLAGQCCIYGGVVVGEGAAVTAGVVLSHTTRIYDAVEKRYYKAQKGQPLVVPPGAIVAPGARPVTKGPSAQSGLMLQVPVIIGYKDNVQLDEDLLDSLFE